MLHLDKYMMIFFLVLAIIMGYLMLSERSDTVSVGRLGQPVPEFSLGDLSQENEYTENDLKGKWRLLNVWASWCAPCKLEHPVLLDLSKKGYSIVGMNFKDEPSDAASFLKSRGNPYEFVMLDQEGYVGFDLGVYGVPETLLIDPEGIIRYRHAGVLTETIFENKFLPIMQNERGKN